MVWRPLRELLRRRELVRSLTRKELQAKYRGSVLGFAWAMLTPAVMIAIYTFIFAGLFGARFGARGTKWDYALYLFCGLLPWTAFQESMQGASNVIVNHANLVKRVVFPLEALPLSQTLAAHVTQLLGTVVLLAAVLLVRRELHATLLWLPLLFVPQVLFVLGAAWFVASLGVFLRDTAQVVALVLVAWFFLTPIIYPEQVIPAHYQRLASLNPFAPLVRSYRRVIIEGAPPDWAGMLYFAVVALVVFLFGYWWFARSRKNFADVI
ncbi:MAG: lipopolysaccharide transport system permease protein [Acidobacteriota bacterium]|nr:lipopolysaccharide transport system permease protein [Acidobacteriota bacterium]